MHFFYFDSQAKIHSCALTHPLKHPVIDIDLSWVTVGHQHYPSRLHAMACFERVAQEVPEDHQFTFRQWFDARERSTHCVWYSMPKRILDNLPHHGTKAQSLLFILPRYFPPCTQNKSLVCFVDLPDCECVVGYQRGYCVCFKKLPPKTVLNVQQEWQYLQQMYPQWTFDHSLYLTAKNKASNTLVQTHQTTIQIDACTEALQNRITIYGLA